MSVELMYMAFRARTRPTPPSWSRVPQWLKSLAELVEASTRTGVANDLTIQPPDWEEAPSWALNFIDFVEQAARQRRAISEDERTD